MPVVGTCSNYQSKMTRLFESAIMPHSNVCDLVTSPPGIQDSMPPHIFYYANCKLKCIQGTSKSHSLTP